MKTLIKILFLSVVLVASPIFAETFVLPSVVVAPGSNGSYWKTAIGVYNSTTTTQTAEAQELSGLGDIPTVTLEAGWYMGTEDLGSLFNLGEGTFLARVTTSDPGVVVSARTYSVTTDENGVVTPGQSSTILTPLKEVSGTASFAFTRVTGARKALFLYGSLTADCVVNDGSAVYVFFSTLGELTRHVLPENTVACKVTAQGLPSGWENTLSYAWGTEADNITNCPTLFNAE